MRVELTVYNLTGDTFPPVNIYLRSEGAITWMTSRYFPDGKLTAIGEVTNNLQQTMDDLASDVQKISPEAKLEIIIYDFVQEYRYE